MFLLNKELPDQDKNCDTVSEKRISIVVLTTSFLDKPTANGLCAIKLIDEMKQRGLDVDVICYKHETNPDYQTDTYIHTIPIPKPLKTQKKDLLHKAINKIKRDIIDKIMLSLGLVVTAANMSLVDSYYQVLKRIISEKPVDIVVAVFFPAEALEALYRIKKENPDIYSVVYELDSIGDGIGNTSAYNKWLFRMYSKLNAIVVMRSHEKYWRGAFGESFADKMIVADLPVLSRQIGQEKESRDTITFIYSGVLEKQYRSPDHFLEIMRQLEDRTDIDFRCCFYSRGDCEEIIAACAQKSSSIVQKGYISQDKLLCELDNADFLISIGNSVSRSLPSKLVTYISFCKPIIHLSSQEDDVCSEFLKDYPLALILHQNCPAKENAEKILCFVRDTAGKRVSFDEVKRNYYMNTPEYSCDAIMEKYQRDQGSF